MSRRSTGPSQDVRDLCYLRDRMSCTVCGETYALQLHHRRPRASGGTRRPETNSPANLVLLCEGCHAAVESQRDLARERGYLVRQTGDPCDVPLVWHGEWVLLSDDGAVTKAAS